MMIFLTAYIHNTNFITNKLAHVPITDSVCYANLSDIQSSTTELLQRSARYKQKCLITFLLQVY